MTIYKVSHSLFSTIKTIQKALDKCKNEDQIVVSAGQFDEDITVRHTISIKGAITTPPVITGELFIKDGAHVHFKNCHFRSNFAISNEGKATFENCQFNGEHTSILFINNGGNLNLINCSINNALEIGIYSINEATLSLSHCHFKGNHKSHVLAESSKLHVNYCSFQESQHAIWLKGKSTLKMHHCDIKEHSGTQCILQAGSIFNDTESNFTNGQSNAFFVTSESQLHLYGTIIQNHLLTQIWIQNSYLKARNCTIQHSKESGIMLKNAEATFYHCHISRHKLSNIQVTKNSLLNMKHCQILESDHIGVQIQDQSIANFDHSTFSKNAHAQLFLSSKSITSLKESVISNGGHVGIHIENEAQCTAVDCHINQHPNTGITVVNALATLIRCVISHNLGNGLLVLDYASLQLDQCSFSDNEMPHLAAKNNSVIYGEHCHFNRGKAVYILEHVNIMLTHCLIQDGGSVQIDLHKHVTANFSHCKIKNGEGNAIRLYENCTLNINHCKIFAHKQPQIVINDSSIICTNSEVFRGGKNAFIIENNSEALLQDCFISRHHYTQIWVDAASSIEVMHTQITDGDESDLFIQNNSSALLQNCIIFNAQFPCNIQAIDFSKIVMKQCKIENKKGQKYYTENNSVISENYDEVDY